METTDLSLLKSYAASRDAEAFTELVRRHAGMVFGVARRVTRNAADAEDIAQGCFLELASKAPSIASSPAGWLHRVAMHRSRDFLRSRSSRQRHESQASQLQAGNAEASWEELEPLIDELLQRLAEDLRLPLVLHYLEGRSQVEVANELGLSQATVSRRLSEGIERIRHWLQDAHLSITAASLAALLSDHAVEAAPPALVAGGGKIAIAGIGAAAASSRIQPKTLLAAGLGIALVCAGTWLLYDLVHERDATRAERALMIAPTPPVSVPATEMFSTRKTNAIAGVRALAWNQGRENTFAASLESALAATEHPVDYNTIMGSTGLAFRMRWIKRRPGQNWSGTAPTGTMPLPIASLQRGTGWRVSSYWVPPARRQPEQRHWSRVTASIDRGLPVIGYEPKMNCGVFYGFDDFGRILLMKDHYAGADGARYPVQQLPINFIFLESWSPPDPPRDVLVGVLNEAVAAWQSIQSAASGHEFWMGDAAYSKWIEETTSIAGLTPAELDRLFFVNWWTFTSLIDARQTAAEYLELQKEVVESSARAALMRAALTRAADHYRSMADLGRQVIAEKQIFRGRWTGETRLNQWTDDVRSRERSIINQLRQLDQQAIADIIDAVSAAKSPGK